MSGRGSRGGGGGWSRLTRKVKGQGAEEVVEEFPQLGRAVEGSHAEAQSRGSFAAVAKKGVEEDEAKRLLQQQVYSRLQALGGRRQALGAGVVGELKQRYPWADSKLVEDVVAAVEGEREMAAACLDCMAPASEADAQVLDDEDPYFQYRRKALEASRARQKLGRKALNAYLAGYHSAARRFSREARQKRALAEHLHAQAAEAIFRERNPLEEAQLWTLDLHGLHTSEAASAVHHRLSRIENLLSQNPSAGLDHHLNIVTGRGVHSRNGASLPSAVNKYLVANRYRFYQPRAGVLAVHPKIVGRRSVPTEDGRRGEGRVDL